MSIYNARKRAGVTQEEVAKSVGVTAQAISLWESGKCMPRAATLYKVAKYLGCTVDELLAEEDTT